MPVNTVNFDPDLEILSTNNAVANDVSLGIELKNPVVEVMSLFPNPANSQLIVNFNISASSDISLVLMNAIGQTVVTKSLPSQNFGNHQITLTVDELAAGIYTCKLTSGGGTYVRTFEIIH
jgi:hypothetical protein